MCKSGTDGRPDGRTEQLPLAIALSKTEDQCAKTEYVKKPAYVVKISLKYGGKTKYER